MHKECMVLLAETSRADVGQYTDCAPTAVRELAEGRMWREEEGNKVEGQVEGI